MSKACPDSILDAPWDAIIAAATTIYLCSGQPANFAAIAAVALGQVGVDSGDFAKADGDVSGRKLTIAAQSGVPITADGTVNHIVVASDSVLLYVTTCPAQNVTNGNTATVAAWKAEFADPT